MRKIIILAVIMALLVPGLCWAAQPVVFDTSTSVRPVVGIFLEAPVTYANNEKVRKMVPDKTVPLFPVTQFKVLPFDQTSMALRTYKEDNDLNQSQVSAGMVNMSVFKPVKRTDIQKIAQELKADYALFIIVSNDAPRFSAGFLSMTYRTTVTCDVRLLDVATGKYLVSKQIIKDGSSTSIYMGIPSFDNAYNEALEKALSELTINVAELKRVKESEI